MPDTLRDTADVLILGGGLAGLTLALQLRQRDPQLRVCVLERQRHPVPAATHKVGESSVEIGAHYFAEVLGLKAHLQQAQLRKFGFRFFFSDGQRDLSQVGEIGASRHLSVPSYQIDRGLFENFLGEEAQRRGVVFEAQALVRQVQLAEDDTAPHLVRWEQAGVQRETAARWVVDACGRAGLLKRQLNLAETNDHAAHAVWFRIGARITLDDWVDDPAWRARCTPPARWLSTNHLVGPGYWVWLIPLASGSHSVGIVADPALQPLERMNTFERAMAWLAERQPRLHEDLLGKQHLLQDFKFLKRFSHGCKQVFSARRWALTGEAGLFLDPFYSPGSDFIAISNTYITDLVLRDRAGRRLDSHARLYDEVYHSFYEATLALYQDQYALFGDPEVLPAKVIWDYAYYWGVLAQFAFQGRLTDLHALGALREDMRRCKALNAEVQAFFRDWSAVSRKRNPAVMHDQAALPWFAALNASLNDRLDDEAFRTRIRDSAAMLHGLAASMRAQAQADYPALAAGRALPAASVAS
jgi:flavin-dependent dehydrogenase